jgi:hypothetical protein
MVSVPKLQAARGRWHAGDAREWTSDEEEDFADLLTYAAPRRPRFNVHSLSQPDHLTTLSTPPRCLSQPTSMLCPWGANANRTQMSCIHKSQPTS